MALAFVCVYTCVGVPEQALGWFPLGLGLVIEDEPSELSCLSENLLPNVCYYE